MFGKKKDKRFIIADHANIDIGIEYLIYVDQQTGVNYLMLTGIGSSGITPLLDATGNVVVSSLPIRETSEEMDM